MIRLKSISNFYLKIVGVGLLLVFLIAQFFGFIYWKKELILAKAEACVAKQKSELVSLSFHDSEIENLDWEDEKEFSFKGLMYDVVSTSTNGDSTTFMCYADEKETWIVEEIEELKNNLFGSSSNTKKESKHQNLKDFPLFCQLLPEYQNAKYCFIKNTLFAKYIFLYKHTLLDSMDLPPQFFV